MARTSLRGIELAWSEAGSSPAAEGGGTGDVVLFLHGFPFDRRLWAPQLAALPAGWRGIAPDLRGFGESSRTGDPAYTMEQHAADAIALLDHLEVERAVVCGLSMGGYIALAMQRSTPARVRALVLADTRAEPDSADARRQRAEQAQAIERDGEAPFIDGMLPKLLADDAPARAREVVRTMMEATAPETLVRALRGLAERPDAREALAAIDVPTLVIGGTEDRITTPDVLRALAAAIPHARLELIEGAGHVSNLEAERAFNDALHSFLQALPR